jgi:hypothetical protein
MELPADVLQLLSTSPLPSLVTLSTSGGSTPGGSLLLFPTLSPAGGVSWHADGSAGAHLRRHVQTKKWLVPMLNHADRNAKYAAAIKEALDAAAADPAAADAGRSLTSPAAASPPTVLDVGAGSGLLSCISASHPSRPQVAALEMCAPMAQLASEVLSGANLRNAEVLPLHSDDYAPPSPASTGRPPPPDLCTSELLDYQLIGEGILPCMRSLFARGLISPATAVIPGEATLVATLLRDTPALPLSSFSAPPPEFSLPSSPALAPPPVPLQLKRFLPGSAASGPCEPLSSPSRDPPPPPPPAGRAATALVPATASCTVTAVCFHWELLLLPNHPPVSSSPDAPFQDHWPQAVCVLPEEGWLEVEEGDVVEVTACHDDESVWFAVKLSGGEEREAKKAKTSAAAAAPAAPQPPPPPPRPPAPPFSALRTRELNAPGRSAFFSAELSDALELSSSLSGSPAPPLLLDVGDFSLCAILASTPPISHPRTASLEASPGSLPLTTARVCQVSNALSDPGKFEILAASPEQLSASDLRLPPGGSCGVVACDLHFWQMESSPLLSSLNFLNHLSSLRASGLLGPATCVVPRRARIMAAPLELPDLAGAYVQSERNVGRVLGGAREGGFAGGGGAEARAFFERAAEGHAFGARACFCRGRRALREPASAAEGHAFVA